MSSRLAATLIASLPRACLAAFIIVAATPALAQYKVIGNDGRVTYTDREPTAAEGKVVPLGGRSAAVAADSGPELPFELRQTATKYPVTLYVTTSACEPCTAARQMLKQRGIPFSERLIITNEDGEALERLSGGRDAPTLSIGSQTLRGFASDVWSSYLDAAGYPRESHLPTNYQYRPATPIVQQQPQTSPRADAKSASPAVPVAPSPTPPSTPGGIKF